MPFVCCAKQWIFLSKVDNFSFLFSDPESRIQTIQHAHSSSYDETSEGGEAGETSSQTSSAKVATAGVQRKASTASSSSKASSVASSLVNKTGLL